MNLIGKNIKILVVDDDPMMLEVLKELLSEAGAIVDTGENGLEGFSKFSEEEYDLIISDIQMPKLNGVDFLKKVREMNSKKPKFILITGFSTYSADEIKKLGANALINKPFEFDEFMHEVTATMESFDAGGSRGA